MKILLTGMTSAQVNPVAHDRSPNFPGLINEALKDTDTVQWSEPSVSWGEDYLRQFDLVIVGIAPITGLGANRAYGALSVISLLWGDPRLRLLVDAPDPRQMESANQALVDHPKNIAKDFYSYRKEYVPVRNDPRLQKRLVKGARHLAEDSWPVTIVPALPWHASTQVIERQLPRVGPHRLQKVNLDHLLFERYGTWQTSLRNDEWAYEKSSHPNWLGQTQVTWPVEYLPRNHRKAVWADTMNQLAHSEGCLISPSKAGTWWSPRYAMSLAVRTPVFTDWHESQFLSESWMVLPGTFEIMSADERNDLADEQFATYYKATQEASWTIG